MKRMNFLLFFAAGLLMGVVSKLLDLYTTNLGNIFSELGVWILLCVIISVFSIDAKRAALRVFLFCIGMLMAYYMTAELLHGVYSRLFITGWSLFALCSPVFAFITWFAKEKGVIPKVIGAGIIATAFLSSVVLFDGPRIYDFIIAALLGYILFFKRIKRGE